MTAMRAIDLNADLGEGGANDASLLELVTSANIACGGHAGDDETMRRSIDLALARGVAIGAHPGYEDRGNFGRREIALPLEEVTALVRRQVEKLAKLASDAGGRLHHVKPHGALYNQASRDSLLADAVVMGVTAISHCLILYALPNSALAAAGRAAGLTVWHEGFADRRYLADGSLMPRSALLHMPVIDNVDDAVANALDLISRSTIDTLCVHGDGPAAVPILKALQTKLGEVGMAARA